MIAALLLTACGDDSSKGLIVDGQPPDAPYDGPMTLTEATGSGVAGLALECDGEPYGEGSVDYSNGLSEVQDSPEEAVSNAMDAWALPVFEIPDEGYRRERDEGETVLLSYDVSGDTKVAIVLAANMSDYLDHEGWGVESWAQCDPSELPPTVTDELELGVWEDEAGERVPVTEIRSYQGDEHCDWEDITFLQADFLQPPILFVRDTDDGLGDYLTTTFATVDQLPVGASDSGYHRDGRTLWLASEPDAAYLVSQSDPSDIERWPAATEPIGCA